MASVNFDSSVGGDGSTVSDDASPTTGLANYGWKTRFVPALANIVAIALWVKNKALEVLGFALSATNAPNTQATSTTSLAIGTGSKSLTVQPGKSFLQGHYIVLASQGTASQSMLGQVTSYNSSTGALVVNVTNVIGAGTYADWVAYTAGHQLEFAVMKNASGNVGLGVAYPTQQFSIGNDAANASTRGIGFVFAATERGSITYTGNIAEMRLTSGYTGYGGFITQATNGVDRTTLDASGNFTLIGGGVLGYGVGSGGTATQPTSKSTGVTLNKSSGQITMHGAALAAGATVAFSVSCNKITSSAHQVFASMYSSIDPTNYQIWAANAGVGLCTIYVKNISGGSLSEALVLNFAVLAGATS